MEESEIQTLLQHFSQSSNALKKVTKRLVALQTLAQELQDTAVAFEAGRPLEPLLELLERHQGSFASLQEAVAQLHRGQEEALVLARQQEQRQDALEESQARLGQELAACRELLAQSLQGQQELLALLAPAAEEELRQQDQA